MTQAIVDIHQLSKGFNDGEQRHQVLLGVDLALAKGDTIALTGPSGTGKSTLLNLIAGFEHPDDGDIQLLGESTANWQDSQWSHFRREQLGMVFQQFNLLTPLNVRDNILFPLGLIGLNWSEWCDHLVDTLGLRQVINRRVEQLSGGQQQRVAIARALVHQPKLLLADEPTGNLDQAAGEQVMSLLCELAKASNSSILMVTHSEACAGYMSRRWHLDQGNVHE